MKKTLLLSILLSCAFYSFSQDIHNQNFKFCNEVIKTNEDYSVETKFEINNHELTQNERTNLINYLYEKSSIYNVRFNSKNNEVYIYHLSQVNYEDLKILMSPLNIEFNFIYTKRISFRYNNNQVTD